MNPKTLFTKIWENHLVEWRKNSPAVLYIDVHYLHEVTSPQAFYQLRKKHRAVRRPDLTFATCDHVVSTVNPTIPNDKLSKLQIETLMKNCQEFGITLYDLTSDNQGIVHVIGPELGITQPGMTIVCGDSHTSTHGAFGALAFGIGTTQVEQVLATQCLLQNPMKTMEINISGRLGKGVGAKDVILTIISKIGTKGGIGFCIEYTGSMIRNLDMEGRMTICNMSIEAGARAGMIAPDQITFSYLAGRKFAPRGKKFALAVEQWKKLHSDTGAKYDKNVTINGDQIEPMITWGTNPSQVIKISEKIPHPQNATTAEEKMLMEAALKYMDLDPKMKIEGFPIDYVFIGSCTNARISDLRSAAKIVAGRKIKSNIIALVVPGSQAVKFAAEKEGLDKIFKNAGFQWRWPGCSACLGMNQNRIPAGKYCISTSNRNFEGRQGPGARTFLASPLTAAASALTGNITDARNFL